LRVAIIGSRGFTEYSFFVEKVEYLLQNIKEEIVIVSGGCKGSADELSERYAAEKGIKTEIYLPEYGKYGRVAPLKRNKTIMQNSDKVICFWDGVSRGTLNAIGHAKDLELPIKIVKI
jgi:hypothetical protein